MNLLGKYDPAEVQLVVAGLPIVGYSGGTFVTAERNEDTYSYTPGSDGSGVRVRNQNKSGRFTITLLQTSPSNDHLSAQHALAESSSVLGVFPVLLKDGLGRTVLSAANAWVVKPATGEFGKEQTDRTWIIETNNLQGTVGGS